MLENAISYITKIPPETNFPVGSSFLIIKKCIYNLVTRTGFEQ